MTRREARESAFILIFEKEFNDSPSEELLELAENCSEIKTDDFSKAAFAGVYDNLSEIDKTISEYAVSWNIKRISKTALAALRLAIYEINFVDDIPISVSINEAVELMKKYATKEDASFVNGILSSVAKAKENA